MKTTLFLGTRKLISVANLNFILSSVLNFQLLVKNCFLNLTFFLYLQYSRKISFLFCVFLVVTVLSALHCILTL